GFLNDILRVLLVAKQPSSEVVRGIQVRQHKLLESPQILFGTTLFRLMAHYRKVYNRRPPFHWFDRVRMSVRRQESHHHILAGGVAGLNACCRDHPITWSQICPFYSRPTQIFWKRWQPALFFWFDGIDPAPY